MVVRKTESNKLKGKSIQKKKTAKENLRYFKAEKKNKVSKKINKEIQSKKR